MKNRGFEKSTIKFWDLQYSEELHSLRFPIYLKTGEHYSDSYRTTESDVLPKYLHPGFRKKEGHLYGEGQIDIDYQDVYLTEGALDAMWLWQNGFNNAFAFLGSPSIEQIKHCVDLGSNFILCFDADKAGVIDTEKVAKELRHRRLAYQIVKLPDGKDVQDLPSQELIKIIRRK